MGTIGPGVPLRIGQSEWRAEGGPVPAHFNAQQVADWFGARVSAVAGIDRLEGFRPDEMFSSLKDKHTDEDVEEYFITGTRTTTPALAQIQAVWPKPWVFFKVFTALLAVFVGCAIGLIEFKNENFLPGLMVIGSFVIPLSVLLFYFEMNIPRNVSIYQVFRMVFIGGTISLVVSLLGYQWTSAFSFLGGIVPGVVEELGKVAALILVVNNRRYPWTLNGLLLGGAVGAGFAGFESAGYAFKALVEGNAGAMLGLIVERGLLAPGGHVAWAALNGAALWKVKGDQPFDYRMLGDVRFLRVLLLTIVLHSLWDTIGSYPVWAVLIAAALMTVLMFVQDGIKQVQHAQVEAEKATPFQGAAV
jgi:RsiW-degrading membrane proteinase PrsW (M82 family)